MATINTNMSANVAANSMVRNEGTMTSQIRGIDQAVRNANEAISMIQVAEGAIKEVTNRFQRMRELAVQAIWDSNTNNDRAAFNDEFKHLSAEVQRIAENTQWNGPNILDNTIGSNGVSTFQIDANPNQIIDVDFGNLASNTVSLTSTGSTTSVTGTANAEAGVAVLKFEVTFAEGDIISYKVDGNDYG